MSIQETIYKLFELMAKCGDLTQDDLGFAYRMGYHTGKIEALEEQMK